METPRKFIIAKLSVRKLGSLSMLIITAFSFVRVVRMSSPMINNIVLLGCFLCYVFVFLLGIDSRFVDDHVFGILCNVSHNIGVIYGRITCILVWFLERQSTPFLPTGTTVCVGDCILFGFRSFV